MNHFNHTQKNDRANNLSYHLNTVWLIVCLIPLHLFSQAPPIKWEKTLGGNSQDELISLQQTTDGGYILAGFSYSNISGDKTDNSKGFTDYWVVKLDADGNKSWDKTIGGNYYDQLISLKQTADGGYILGGASNSEISGDKTENSKGEYDYWVVKLDANGNTTWDKTIGGNFEDVLFSLQQTYDGGYILGGYSISEISGDKTENPKGNDDYWIVKLDANGNTTWDKTIGGNLSDRLVSIQQTDDGGYILGGQSYSDISSDKTENSQGDVDYWLVKLNVNGNKIWDKTIGGDYIDLLYSLQQTSDGGYVLGGYSYSNISGDKTENARGDVDYWVVKLDVSGNKIWDKTIGGFAFDQSYSLQESDDGGYIVGGTSYSGISGDRTEDSKGLGDYWVVKLDESGNKLWDKAIGGDDHDEFRFLQQTHDGGYVLGGYSYSDISGDKTENSKGITDYWVVKLEADNNCSSSTLAVTIPDAYALTTGVIANTVYIAYQPASSITLTASPSGGNVPYSYNWSTVLAQTTPQITVSPTSVGGHDYTVTVTDASGCTAEFTKTITVEDISSDKKKTKVYICHRDSRGTWTQLSILTGSVANHLVHGDYLGFCNNNSSNSEILTRAASEKGDQEIIQKGFKIYPNPATHFLDVLWSTKNTSQTSIRILNAEGKTVKTITTQGAVNQQRISLDGLAKGVYMLLLKTGAGQQVSKFVIQ